MKSLKIIFFLSLFFPVCLFSQEETDTPKNKIKKNFIKIRTEYLQFLDKKPVQTFLCQKKFYDRKGYDTLTLFYSITNDQVFSKVTKKFDSNGNVTERRLYKRTDYLPPNKSAALREKKTFQKVTNKDDFVLETVLYSKFDEKGRFIKAEEYDEKGNFLKNSKVENKFDSLGRIIESSSFFSDAKGNTREVFTYDSCGNKIGFELYDHKGVKSQMLYSYDKKGKIIKIVSFNNRLKTKEIEQSKYDAKGNRVFKSISDGDGNVFLSQYFKYNRFGRMIEMKRETNVKFSEFWKMTLTYDKYGYLLSNTKYNEQQKPYRKSIYKYVYYK